MKYKLRNLLVNNIILATNESLNKEIENYQIKKTIYKWINTKDWDRNKRNNIQHPETDLKKEK